MEGLFSLNGKVSIVTGAGRGLGYGIALALAGAGSDMIIVSRSDQELKRASEEIAKKTNQRILPFPLDLTKEGETEKLVKRAVDEFGRIDVLVNNAGTNIRKPFLEINRDEFNQVIKINLTATFFLSQAIAKQMIRQKKGKIINIASLTSQIGISNVSVYGATKGGIASLTKVLAVELANNNINVNAIAPGYFKTQMTEAAFNDETRYRWILSRIPLGRGGIPEDLAGTAIFLASSASDYITGQIIFVDGGWISA